MKRVALLFLLVSLNLSCISQVSVVKFATVDSLLQLKPAKPIVLNFWATWCKPCVQELPYFIELQKNYSLEGVKVILVSMDFKKDVDTRVKPFVLKNNIVSEVLVLDAPDYNSWIDKVDRSWSGAIPATVVITNKEKLFFEKEFSSYAELENTIKPYLQQ